jgi:hypothetical protein
MGSVAKSYMSEGFLINDEMRKYLTIYEEAISHIWLIYDLYMLFFFLSVQIGKEYGMYRLSEGRDHSDGCVRHSEMKVRGGRANVGVGVLLCLCDSGASFLHVHSSPLV